VADRDEHALDRDLAQLAGLEVLQPAAVFSSRQSPVPVVAAKSHFGNLGAASGLVELIASLEALQHNHLFRTLNHDTPDPECPVSIATADSPAGDAFLNVSVTPQGQASGVVVKRFG
jgi:3-oxoacyl-[acyl-carrier-protein] synthase II